MKTKSGQGTDDSPKLKFEDQMSFLDNFMKERRQKSSLPESGEESHLLEQDEVDSEEPITNLLVNSEESSSALSVAQSPTPYAPPSHLYHILSLPNKFLKSDPMDIKDHRHLKFFKNIWQLKRPEQNQKKIA